MGDVPRYSTFVGSVLCAALAAAGAGAPGGRKTAVAVAAELSRQGLLSEQQSRRLAEHCLPFGRDDASAAGLAAGDTVAQNGCSVAGEAGSDDRALPQLVALLFDGAAAGSDAAQLAESITPLLSDRAATRGALAAEVIVLPAAAPLSSEAAAAPVASVDSVLPPLLATLFVGSPAAKGRAACVLADLVAASDALSRKIVKAGALPPLVALLEDRSATRTAKAAAARALAEVAAGKEGLCEHLVACGAVPPLLALLASGSADGAAKGSAARAVAAVAAAAAAGSAGSRVSRCIHWDEAYLPLVVLLSSGEGAGSEHAARALRLLIASEVSNARRDDIIAAGALGSLSKLVFYGYGAAQAAAIELLLEVAAGSGLYAHLVKAACAPPADASDKGREAAVRVIASI